MFEVAALTYGMLATFIMSSFRRNRRDERRDPAVLVAFGWAMMAFSATVAVGLAGYVAYAAFTGHAVAAPPIA
jgi:hypothetical protein